MRIEIRIQIAGADYALVAEVTRRAAVRVLEVWDLEAGAVLSEGDAAQLAAEHAGEIERAVLGRAGDEVSQAAEAAAEQAWCLLRAG